MKTELTNELLAGYFNGKPTLPTYAKAVEMYRALAVHAKGEVPLKIIATRRPNESGEVKDYRMSIYRPITAGYVGAVISSLEKIRRARDWRISYPTEATFPLVPHGETLQEYCEEKFPHYNSLTEWLFTVLLPQYTIDANLLILMAPLEAVAENELLRPYPTMFQSDQVYEYRPDDYAVLRSGTTQEKYFVVTTTDIKTYVKRPKASEPREFEWVVSDIVLHNLGYLPLIKPRGKFKEFVEGHELFTSRIATMVPHLDEAACEFSDLQASKVMHVYPERWEIATQDCTTCNGAGRVPAYYAMGTDGASKPLIDCTNCKGLGKVSATGPYGVTLHRPALSAIEQPIPMPAAGYIEKDMGIVNFMATSYERQLYNALCAVNMQYLAQVPAAQSGIAKSLDRDELNNFVYGVASDLIYMLKVAYNQVCDYRHGFTYPNANDRRDMLPTIPIPKHYDLVGADGLLEQITHIKTDVVGRTTTRAMKMDILESLYQNMPDKLQPAKLELILDPYDGIAETDLVAMKLNDGLDERGFIIHCNINWFIQKARELVAGFDDMGFVAQMGIMDGYAAEVVAKKEAKMIQVPPTTTNALPYDTSDDDAASDSDPDPVTA